MPPPPAPAAMASSSSNTQPLVGSSSNTQPLAGGASQDPDLMKKHGIDDLIPEWLGWRKRFAVRAQPLARTHLPRPRDKNDQEEWSTYESRHSSGRLNQEWLCVPITRGKQASTKPLAQQGADPASGGRMQHFTNIERVKALAMKHPLIDEVEDHKTTKANDKTISRTASGEPPRGTSQSTTCVSSSQPLTRP